MLKFNLKRSWKLSEDFESVIFQYTKKNNREDGPAVVGIELKNRDDLQLIEERLKKFKIRYQYLNQHKELFTHLII